MKKKSREKPKVDIPPSDLLTSQKQPKEEPVVFKKPPKEKRFINVGIDFGTSGTKVIYRDIIGKQAWTLGFNHKLENYPDFVLPSSLRVIDGKLYFGSEAERKSPHGRALRSFKVCMVCENGAIPQGSCNLVYDPVLHPRSGPFYFQDGKGEMVSFSPLELGAYYLAYVIGFVNGQIEKQFAKKKYDLSITYNMCVPINYIEDEKVAEGFNRCLFLANSLSSTVKEGCDIHEIRQSYKELADKFFTIPGKEDRPTFIQPETIVSVFSYVMSPQAEDGLYAIADVGAGTTDISFFRLLKSSLRPKISVYSAGTYMIGANEVDKAILDLFESRGSLSNTIAVDKRSELMQQIRLHKQRMTEEESVIIVMEGSQCELRRDDFHRVCAPIGERVFKEYLETWRSAYSKECKESRWKEYTLFRIGGGSRIKEIGRQLSQKPWDRIKKIILEELQTPSDLSYQATIPPTSGDSFNLLAIAYGLSYHPAMYPEITLPGKIPICRPKPPIKDLPPWYQYWEQD